MEALQSIMSTPMLSVFLRPSGILFSVLILITASGFSFLRPSKKRISQPNPVLGNAGDRDFHGALYDGYFKVSSHSVKLISKYC